MNYFIVVGGGVLANNKLIRDKVDPTISGELFF
jgi:hypothetical protein